MRSKTVPNWWKNRTYLHFDSPITTKNLTKIRPLIENPSWVSSHAFFPFLDFEIKSELLSKTSGKLKQVTKTRPISYSSHIDSCIYAYYSTVLSESYEKYLVKKNLGDSVLAFRANLGKCNIEFAGKAFNLIESTGACQVIALDIKSFFSELDHTILKQSWINTMGFQDSMPSDHYAVFKSITKYSSVNKQEAYKACDVSVHNPWNGRNRICSPMDFRTKVRGGGFIRRNNASKGIPQGSPVSAVLSNIYLSGFDEFASKLLKNLGGDYLRYCDDMLLIVPENESVDITLLQKEVSTKLESYKVRINQKKTVVRKFRVGSKGLCCDHPLQYLGFVFDGKKIILRSASLSRFSLKMKNGVKLAKKSQKRINDKRVDQGKTTYPLFKKTLYSRYSYIGRRNFISYGFRAAKIMNSKSIRKQLKPLWKRLQLEIDS